MGPKCQWWMSFNRHPFAIATNARIYFLPNILPSVHTSAVIFGIYRSYLLPSELLACASLLYPSSPFAEALECRGQWEDGFQSPWSHTAAVSHKASCRNVSPPKKEYYVLFWLQEAGEEKKDSKENGLGNKRSENFSGQNHICNRLSLSDLSWEMRSPGDRGLELRASILVQAG